MQFFILQSPDINKPMFIKLLKQSKEIFQIILINVNKLLNIFFNFLVLELFLSLLVLVFL